ncbi:hypothetical protein CA13_06560 [Planctomycetes bacterium CA13]|uniref:Uncharacterized protein n=1 Tax=Novipirellula herctigrandis TaxID=2527986 RepID=A0A5C5YW59_9BACT|nr:hypothetical protein CA13_06560 [Planctomycetes bacterium CA13]
MRHAGIVAIKSVPMAHGRFETLQAERHFAGRGTAKSRQESICYDLAIVHNPDDKDLAPPDSKAL